MRYAGPGGLNVNANSAVAKESSRRHQQQQLPPGMLSYNPRGIVGTGAAVSASSKIPPPTLPPSMVSWARWSHFSLVNGSLLQALPPARLSDGPFEGVNESPPSGDAPSYFYGSSSLQPHFADCPAPDAAAMMQASSSQQQMYYPVMENTNAGRLEPYYNNDLGYVANYAINSKRNGSSSGMQGGSVETLSHNNRFHAEQQHHHHHQQQQQHPYNNVSTVFANANLPPPYAGNGGRMMAWQPFRGNPLDDESVTVSNSAALMAIGSLQNPPPPPSLTMLQSDTAYGASMQGSFGPPPSSAADGLRAGAAPPAAGAASSAAGNSGSPLDMSSLYHPHHHHPHHQQQQQQHHARMKPAAPDYSVLVSGMMGSSIGSGLEYRTTR